jgi:hypothetical protein
VFIALLFVPTVVAFSDLARKGWRPLLTSRTALMLSPVAGLAATVAIATGEVRYRIPFDLFFMTVACAFAVGDFRRIERV